MGDARRAGNPSLAVQFDDPRRERKRRHGLAVEDMEASPVITGNAEFASDQNALVVGIDGFNEPDIRIGGYGEFLSAVMRVTDEYAILVIEGPECAPIVDCC